MFDYRIFEEFDQDSFLSEEHTELKDFPLSKDFLSKYKGGVLRLVRRILLEKPNLSNNELEEIIDYELLKCTSQYFFPGNICFFYPKFFEKRARKKYVCDISGSIIQQGSFYLSYRPSIDNITLNRTFVLKRTIIAESSYFDFFPSTFDTFEELARFLAHSYELFEMDYDYYGISKRIGDLSLLELRKRR